MRLAIFDVDGTLTDTNAIDTECFVEALASEFGIHAIDEDWSSYPHATDRSILGEVLRRALGRAADEAELAKHRNRFLTVLDERMSGGLAISGAVEFLQLAGNRGWTIVLCTGAWRDSARLKLTRAGFPADLPIAACDVAPSREEIVRAGMSMCGDAFDRVVAFGDAEWDLRTARNLGLPFIGVGPRSGSACAIDDYTDAEAVLALMDVTRAPR